MARLASSTITHKSALEQLESDFKAQQQSIRQEQVPKITPKKKTTAKKKTETIKQKEIPQSETINNTFIDTPSTTAFEISEENDEEIKDNKVSASAIRKLIRDNKDISSYTPYSDEILNADKYYLDEYFPYLKHKLLTTSSEELTTIHLVNEGIENLFKKQIIEATSMDDFIGKCISKRYTHARIKRTICHILLNTKKDFAKEVLSKDVTYIRILGTNKKGQEYLGTKYIPFSPHHSCIKLKIMVKYHK